MAKYIELATQRIFETDEEVALHKGLCKELVESILLDKFDPDMHVRVETIDLDANPATLTVSYRDMTAGERTARVTEINAPIQAQLDEIDKKKTRAMTDALLNNDLSRLRELEAAASALRDKLVK